MMTTAKESSKNASQLPIKLSLTLTKAIYWLQNDKLQAFFQV